MKRESVRRPVPPLVRAADRIERRLFSGPLATNSPRWRGEGKLGWRWRVVMALRALAGYELAGFDVDRSHEAVREAVGE